VNPLQFIKGKRVLIVDDEQDVLDTLVDLLSMCKLDTASTFEQAKDLLESNDYDIAILDIMGVNGFELLKVSTERKIPALMLTAHGMSEENLNKSAQEGAAYYAPKEEISKIAIFVADVLDALEKKKNPWVRMMERLGGFYDKRFGGTNWREKELKYVMEKWGQFM
jgi:DNA-binding NtrC family response regulator